MANAMDKELIILLMDVNMKDNGKTIKNMDKEPFIGPMEINI